MPAVGCAITALATSIVVILPVAVTRIRAYSVEICQVTKAMGPGVIRLDRHALDRSALDVKQHRVIAHRSPALELGEEGVVGSLCGIFKRQFSPRR